MEVLEIKEIGKTDLCIKTPFAFIQKWEENRTFNFLGEPKKQQSIIYFSGSNATYSFKDGTKLEVKKGDTVYVPKNAEYEIIFHEVSKTESSVLINFDIECNGNGVNLFSTVTKICPKNKDVISHLFLDFEDSFNFADVSILALNSFIFKILEKMREYENSRILFSETKGTKITEGIMKVTGGCYENISVDELAKLCNVSSSCFRRKFKSIMGVSPNEYIIEKRLDIAKSMLLSQELTVSEISDKLEFCNTAYFCRFFKKKFGVSPSKYVESREE